MTTTTGLPLGAAQPPGPAWRRRRNLWSIVIAIMAVVAAIVAVALVTFGDDKAQLAPNTAAPGTAGPSVSVSPSPPSSQPAPAPFDYQPLWPFVNLAEVQEWQQAYRSGGHQPWHLDADQTALSFTTGIVASTGGHYTDVERFAITGVRP